MKRTEIQIRDPYIVTISEEKTYFLYGTTDKDCWKGKAVGFDAYSSKDLENWEGPYEVFRPMADFWADKNFWAPEVHRYKDKYYMFASFKADGVCRGTQTLVSEKPEGPFMLHSDGPVTPKGWECLDGTLFVDENDDPWMIFCHEWVQVVDGTMCVIKLSKDLKEAVSEPQLLFNASDAPWTRPLPRLFGSETKNGYVTDGPFMYKMNNGKLLMLWSSKGEEGYAIGIARSTSGSILGPWEHDVEPLFKKDGGHGMVFHTFEGDLMLTIHAPNNTPNERPIFLKLEENNDTLILK